nr:hypothetical protein [Escherichia coli]
MTAPSGAVALHTVRCAGSAVSGATGAARPERSLQAWFFRHRTVAAARNRASGFGGDWRVRQQLPVGVGPDDRMPPGSREQSIMVGSDGELYGASDSRLVDDLTAGY